MAKIFSKDDVASHAKGDSPWIIIDEDVYDVSKFQDEHPGMFSKRKRVTHLYVNHMLTKNVQVERRVCFIREYPPQTMY
jgi:proteasome lid subunit RPN8/RPN11